MNRSILWNGFELRKGNINTSVGDIPYFIYTPERSIEPVTIAIHRETGTKEDWLCFNSVYKPGNLLKECIKNNSTFIAFDLYGHGEWLSEDSSFDSTNLQDNNEFLKISSKGLEEAIPQLLKNEGIDNNPVTIVGNSLGCNVVLNIKLENLLFKSVLLSPFNSEIDNSSSEYLIHRGNMDKFVKEKTFNELIKKLPKDSEVILYNRGHDLDENWINSTKTFIYSGSRVG